MRLLSMLRRCLPTRRRADAAQIDAADDAVMAFKRALRELKERAGNPSFRDLADRVDYSRTVLAQAISGRGMPTWSVTAAFVRGCGGDEAEWHRRWLVASESASRATSRADDAGADGDTMLAVDSRQRFAADLARRIDRSGLSRREVAARAGHAASTLSAIVSGHRLPREELLRTLLQAIGASSGEIDQWSERRIRLSTAAETERLLNRIELIAQTAVPATAGVSTAGWLSWRRIFTGAMVCGVAAVLVVGVRFVETAADSSASEAGGVAGYGSADPDPCRGSNASPDRTLDQQRGSPRVGVSIVLQVPTRRPERTSSGQAAGGAVAIGRQVEAVCKIANGSPFMYPDETVSREWVRLLDGAEVPGGFAKACGPLDECG
jgi:transcriptional regulator with XRE-family HTH domain